MLNRQRVEAELKGPNGMFKHADLGMAVGSTVTTVKDFCINNIVMYTKRLRPLNWKKRIKLLLLEIVYSFIKIGRE